MEEIRLVKALANDAELVHKLQVKAFMPLYERYHDDATSPAKESVERVLEKITSSDFLIIYADDVPVGGVRVRRFEPDGIIERHISPIFLIPSYWNKGIGTVVMEKLFVMYDDADRWGLSTIEQEERDCHFYEKLGFVLTGEEKKVNDLMTLVFFEKTV